MLEDIDRICAEKGEMVSTRKARLSNERLFERFLKENELQYDPKTVSDEDINTLLKLFVFALKKSDGSDYKEGSLKKNFN
jgi:hypothetical protein